MNRAVAKLGSILLLSNGAGQGLAFLTSVTIGRLLGVQAFGQYAAVMALVFVFGIAVEAGMETSLTRDVAREPGRSRELLLSSLVAKCALGAALSLLLLFTPLAALLAPTAATLPVLQLLGVLITLNAVNASFSAVFRAWGRMQSILVINVAGLSLQLAGVVILLLLFRSVPILIGWFALVQLFELAMGTYFFRRHSTASGAGNISGQGRAEPHTVLRASTPMWGQAYKLVVRSLPFALGGILGALTIRVDLFLIEGIRGAAAVGVYSVATRLLDLLSLAPNSFLAALLPAFARGSEQSEVGPEQSYRSALRGMVLAAAVLTASGLLLAELLVGLSFGSAYAEAAAPLRLLSLLLFPLLMNRTTTVHLYATNREGVANRALALNLSMRAVIGYPAISVWGIEGAALANLAAETAMLGAYWLWGALHESPGIQQQVTA